MTQHVEYIAPWTLSPLYMHIVTCDILYNKHFQLITLMSESDKRIAWICRLDGAHRTTKQVEQMHQPEQTQITR